jgi:hypothetical protein
MQTSRSIGQKVRDDWAGVARREMNSRAKQKRAQRRGMEHWARAIAGGKLARSTAICPDLVYQENQTQMQNGILDLR